MPLDSLPEAPVTEMDRIVDHALMLLGPDGKRWIKGVWRHFDGLCVGQAIKEAAEFCGHPNGMAVLHQLSYQLGRDIPAINDRRTTKWADIVALLNTLRTYVIDDKRHEKGETQYRAKLFAALFGGWAPPTETVPGHIIYGTGVVMGAAKELADA